MVNFYQVIDLIGNNISDPMYQGINLYLFELLQIFHLFYHIKIFL